MHTLKAFELPSIATAMGPPVATAACRSASLGGISIIPVSDAPTVL